ncbi:Transcriptional regulator, LysR family [Vibrio coralliirubri]|uniref:LysR family transcriptional regulator n=1 Tax=Vibrio coralliirubri TaxID=1516159 RepID=UPI000632C09D|nr:LysR family transcriptional regulator [Vibrio coralliirubri]CDT58206.1 Transcriptional regulator, LysR family [Vibrio coralliirubri]
MQLLRNRLSNFRSLRVYLTVYEQGAISSAAKTLNLTQPTISIQLKQFSNVVGAELYYVQGKKLVFTESGKLTAKYCRQIIQKIDDLEIEISNLAQLKSGTLKVAAVTSCEYFVPHLIGSFLEKFPMVDIDFKIDNRENIKERYNNGQDDLYLFSHIDNDMTGEVVPLFPNNLYAFASKTHPLALKEKVSLKSLVGFSWILRERGSGTRQAIEEHFSKSDVVIRPKLVMESNEAIKHCVMAGMGLSILSEYALTQESPENLTVLPVDTFPIKTYWNLVFPSSTKQSTLSQAFMAHLMEYKQVLKGGIQEQNTRFI